MTKQRHASYFSVKKEDKMKLLLASSNAHKAKEFERLFELYDTPIMVLIPHSIGLSMPEIDECGDSFAANAFIKAKTLFDMTGIPTLADDSGLSVDVLEGNPGIYSARYAGEQANDSDNRQLLIRNINAAKVTNSTGRFVAALAVCDELRSFIVEGKCDGLIINEERGANGFGYDPMFIPTGYEQTFAELDTDIKHTISHRANALKNLIAKLKEYEYI